jgi:carbonic anhydrase/acetyltransferase-like protein (isoleucine patch superfamily)
VESALPAVILPFQNYRPRIADDVYVAPTAALIGDIEIGAGSGIWFGCSLRADGNLIRIGVRTNIQDGTVIHVNGQPDGGRGGHGYACLIGSGVTVGHMVLLHGCTLEDGAFVGMKSCVMDGVVVEGGGMVAAGALVTPNKRVKRGELWAGSPAKLMRLLTPAELEMFEWTAEHYAERARAYRAVSL